MAESLYCSPETTARLLISYMPIQNEKFRKKNYQKKKKKVRERKKREMEAEVTGRSGFLIGLR